MAEGNSLKYVVRCDGFPWTTTKREIVDFFSTVKILNGKKGVHFIVDDNSHSSNDAYIEVASEQDFQRIRKYDNVHFRLNGGSGHNIEGCVFNFII